MRPIAVIADDLTGGLDTGVKFRKAGLETQMRVSPGGWLPSRWQPQVMVYNSDSREVSPQEASQRVAGIAADVVGRMVYKKIDSTMRGNPGVELDALLDRLDVDRVICTPASPQHGRTVSSGRLFINRVPLRKTDFAADPQCPFTDDLAVLLAAQSRFPVHSIDLKTIRSGSRSWLDDAAPGGILLCDAETEADLDRLASAVEMDRVMLCGSAGLAGAVSRRIKPPAEAISVEQPGKVEYPALIVAGSRHPATSKQIQTAKARGDFVEIEVDLRRGDGLARAERAAGDVLAAEMTPILSAASMPFEPRRAAEVAASLGKLTVDICRNAAIKTLFLTGGATAMAVCDAMGIACLDIRAEVLAGIPLSRVAGGAFDGMMVITKAGGFGLPTALLNLFFAR